MLNIQGRIALLLSLVLLCVGSTAIQSNQGNQIFELGNPVAVLGSPENNAEMYQPLDFVGGNGDTVYVLDYGDRMVYTFDHDGNLLFSFGGEGQGPGEFLEPRVIEYSDGKIYAMDVRIPRICIFTSTGVFIRSIHLTRRPLDIAVHNGDIYVSTSWFQGAPVYKIPTASQDIRVLLLENADQFLPKVDYGDFYSMGIRSGRIYLSIIENSLVAAFCRTGVIAVLPLQQEDAVPRWISLEHPLIEEYEDRFRKRLREFEGPGSILPNVFYSASPWLNGTLACELRIYDYEEYTDVEAVLFSLETGREVGLVKVNKEGLSRPQIISPQLVGILDYGTASVILYRLNH